MYEKSPPNILKLESILLNNQLIKEDILRKIKKYFELNKYTTLKILGCS